MKLIKFVVFLSVLLVLLLSFFLTWYAENQWSLVNRSIAPDKIFAIHEFEYHSDANRHAPYGTYLILSSSSYAFMQRRGHVIFAGYCKSNTYVWINSKHIQLNLSGCDKIRTLASSAFGIRITVVEGGS